MKGNNAVLTLAACKLSLLQVTIKSRDMQGDGSIESFSDPASGCNHWPKWSVIQKLSDPSHGCDQ